MNVLQKYCSQFLGVFAKLWKWLLLSSCLSVPLSVRLQGTTQLPLDRLSWNFIFEGFFKNCQENSSFIKVWRPNIHFWSHLAKFFLKWEMFQAKVVQKLKTYILGSINFFQKWCHLRDNVEKYTEPGRPQMAILHVHIACWMLKATHTHTHTQRIRNTSCFSPATMAAQTRLNGTLHIHFLSCRTNYGTCFF
jgi:hypothetical protein